jgi:hypothetical protein
MSCTFLKKFTISLRSELHIFLRNVQLKLTFSTSCTFLEKCATQIGFR